MHVFTKSAARNLQCSWSLSTSPSLPRPHLVAIAFALSTFDRWPRRRRPHELAWTIALALFAIGSAALWWARSGAGALPSFRIFFLAGAMLNVPWLALGTVYLLGGERVGHRVRAWLLWLSGLATGVVLVAPMKGPVPSARVPRGQRGVRCVPTGARRRRIGRVGGRHHRRRVVDHVAASFALAARHPGRVLGNVLIAAGTLVLSASGTLAGRLGKDRAFIVTLLVGIVVLFAGFLVASTAVASASRRYVNSGAAACRRRSAAARRRTGSSTGTCSGRGGRVHCVDERAPRRRRRAGAQHHVRLHRLARVRVRHADDADLGDAGMLGEHLLDLGRIDVEPADDDEVLGPVDEVEVAVVVGRRRCRRCAASRRR